MSESAPTDVRNPDRDRAGGPSATAILAESVRRVVRDPALALPFAIVGVVLALVDRLRLRDPVPTTSPDRVGDVSVGVSFPVYPSGVRSTGLDLAALVDLRPWYLLRTVGLEALAVFAVAFAGWLTISRAAGVTPSRERLVSYLWFVVAVRILLGAFGLFDDLAWVTLLALVALAVAFVRLFAAPALVVVGGDGREGDEAGEGDTGSVYAAASRSSRLAHGRGATVFGLVVAFGVAAWLLGSVPAVGALASTALVAPVHAVAVVTFVESVDPDRNRAAASGAERRH
ncbi:hypothetical protein [Halorussus litoreus]|uniref:hypothetical protein n=1 Tax=Halorussus litoreus TaxID=1710536 RepID=UPI000E23DC84|nr:hypothetical protein [Halorussus litoreus]